MTPEMRTHQKPATYDVCVEKTHAFYCKSSHPTLEAAKKACSVGDFIVHSHKVKNTTEKIGERQIPMPHKRTVWKLTKNGLEVQPVGVAQ